MTDNEGSITTEVKDHILLIGLNRPEKLNGYTPTMATQLVDAMTELDTNDELWVGVLFAHGDHFTAGLDLPKWTDRMSSNDRSHTDQSSRVDPMALGRACRKPIITAVKGITYTFGIELALAGDIIIAADNCRFSQLEPARGIHATGGATIRFVERGGWGNAMYHLLTCDEFGAEEAYRVGLVQEVVATGTQIARAMEIAHIIAQNAPLGIQATKAAGRAYIEAGEASAVNAIDDIRARVMNSQDAAEGIQSFVERRAAVFTGR